MMKKRRKKNNNLMRGILKIERIIKKGLLKREELTEGIRMKRYQRMI